MVTELPAVGTSAGALAGASWTAEGTCAPEHAERNNDNNNTDTTNNLFINVRKELGFKNIVIRLKRGKIILGDIISTGDHGDKIYINAAVFILMIDLKEQMLKHAAGWKERMSIRLWNRPPVNYACSNLEDFLTNQHQIPNYEKVIFPQLWYFPQEQASDDPRSVIPITLRDESAEIKAAVSHIGFNVQERRSLVDSLREVNGGDTLYYPVLSKGRLITGIMQASYEDHQSYFLESFMRHQFGGRKRAHAPLFSQLLLLIPKFKSAEPTGAY